MATAILVAAAVLGFAAASCQEVPAGALRVGANVWPGYEPLFLARNLDYFSTGEVRVVEFASDTQVMRAFRNGVIAAAALTLDEALQLADLGQKLEVVLVMGRVVDDGSIVTRLPVSDMAGLKGARIGVEAGAHEGYLLGRALGQAGIDAADVTIVPLTAEEHERAFNEQRVDAVVTREPLRRRLLEQGARMVWNSSAMPEPATAVLVVRKGGSARHRAHLEALLEGWFDAVRYMRESPGDAVADIQRRLRIPIDEVTRVMQTVEYPGRAENGTLLAGVDAPLRRTARAVATQMQSHDLLARGGGTLEIAAVFPEEAPR